MTVNPSIKETNYSIKNSLNYYKHLNAEDTQNICIKYSTLLTDYFKFILEHIKMKNLNLTRFCIIRGLDTITNVFLMLLINTNNIDLTYFHCQKSFYFYVEFVGQITEDDKMFLQLTSRDAAIYVYKKTIFDITDEYKKNITPNNDVINTVNTYISICKSYMYKIILSDFKLISFFEELIHKLNSITINAEKIKILETIVDYLYYNVTDYNLFFELNLSLINKFIKNRDISKFINECIK